MKAKDVISIATIRLNNKYSHKTIFIMAIGLSFLIPVIWLIFSFYLGFFAGLNNKDTNNVLFFESQLGQEVYICGDSSQTSLETLKGIEIDTQQYEYFANTSSVEWREFWVKSSKQNTLNLRLDGQDVDCQEMTLKFLMTDRIVPSNIDDYIISQYGKPTVQGNGFSNNKREILVSERFLDKYNYDASVIGKKLSLSIDYNEYDLIQDRYRLDNDTVWQNDFMLSKDTKFDGQIAIFKDYTIVGVVSREYYSVNEFTEQDSDFWLRESCMRDSDGNNLFPELSIQDVNDNGNIRVEKIATYPSIDYTSFSQEKVEEGCFFPFIIGNSYLRTRASGELIVPLKLSFVQYDNFIQSKNMMTQFEKWNNRKGTPYRIHTLVLESYVNSYKIISIITAVLGVLGVVVLISVLLNYGNAMSFNARIRRKFMTMMSKMGATSKDKKRLVLVEIFGLYFVSSLLALVVSFVECLILKLVLISISDKFGLSNTINVSLAYFFPAFLAVWIGVSIIVSLIALFVNREYSK